MTLVIVVIVLVCPRQACAETTLSSVETVQKRLHTFAAIKPPNTNIESTLVIVKTLLLYINYATNQLGENNLMDLKYSLCTLK